MSAQRTYDQGWLAGRWQTAYDRTQHVGSPYWVGFQDGNRARARVRSRGR